MKNIFIYYNGKYKQPHSCSQPRSQQGENRQEVFLLTKRYLVWLLKRWLTYQQSLHCVPKNKDAFWMRANMFLSVWLFPWRVGSSIIVFRTQTETDQTHRQPTDQNGSCGSGTHHALIRFGFGLVCADWSHHPSVSLPLPSCLPKQGKIWKRKLEREKLWAVCSTPLRLARPSRHSPGSCGFSELRRHFLCGFFNSSTCHLAGSAIVPCPFLPAPSAETSRVIPSWSALLLPLFLALPQKSILSFMSLPFMHKGTVVACCGAVPLHFHQWGFLSFSSKHNNGALKAWMANAECTILQSPLILFCQSQ